MKLLSIEKTTSAFFTKYKICFLGIKISFKAYIHFILYIKYLIFQKKYNLYLRRKKDKITRRLIITNGNLNLINSLAIINQMDHTSENSIISCTQAKPEFEFEMKEIVKQFPVKKYYSFCNIESYKMITYFINNFLTDFDEIYFTNGHIAFQNLADLYPKAKRYITDEGVCCLFPMPLIDYTKTQGLIFAKYLDKLNTIGYLEEFDKNIMELDKTEFIKTGKKCEELFPLETEFNKEDKNIIFLGTYCHGKTYNFYTYEELLRYQQDIMERLIEKGYKIYFKPHPRDLHDYSENERFKILKTMLPLECYSLKDRIVAVVSVFSSASCQMYHYQGIPGFSSIGFLKNADEDFPTLILKEYTPDIDMLLSTDAHNKSFQEVQEELIKKYENWLKEKPLMSENKFLYSKLTTRYTPLPPPKKKRSFNKHFDFTKKVQIRYTRYNFIIGFIHFSFKIFNPKYKKEIALHKQKYKKYANKKSSDGITRRLILTNGNFNLVNSLALINQLNLKENCENSLVVWTEALPEFEKTMKKISTLVPIHHYYSLCNTNHEEFIYFFIKNMLTDYDEIYYTNGHSLFKRLVRYFPKAKRYITEEGCCTLFPAKSSNYKYVKNFFFSIYLNKLDYAGEKEGFCKNITPLQKSEFLKISNEASKIIPFDIKMNEDKKNIIFLGTFCSIKTGQYYTFDELQEYQNSVMEKLILHGYTVYFKPHPRDLYEYKNSDKIKIIKTKLPLECYYLKDKCCAVVSLFSSVLIHLYHYYQIPGFHSANLIQHAQSDFGINLIKEYCPHVNEMLSFDVKNQTVEEVSKILKRKYEEFLNEKPILSKNKYLQDILNQ